MKPLPRVDELVKGLYNKDEITVYDHRNCLIDLSRQSNGCFVRLKDGTTVMVTLKSNDEPDIQRGVGTDYWFSPFVDYNSDIHVMTPLNSEHQKIYYSEH